MKTILALQHGSIPASLNFRQPNPAIPFARGPFRVNHTLSPWPESNKPRRAGVSSFGIGGTNAPETARRSDGCKLRLDRCVARATRRLCLLHRGLHEGELAEGNARDAPRDQHDQPYCREGATPGARTCSHPPTPPLCCLIPDRAEQTTDRDLKIR